MKPRPKLLAFLLLLAVFVAGGVSSWAIQAWADGTRSPQKRPRGERAIAYLTGELDLTALQQDSLRAVFARYRPAMDSIWRTVHPRFDSVRALVRADVMTHLTPAQQALYRDLMVKMDERHRAGDSSRSRTR
jgi:hypothetical protein